jgi:hypothetical protein
MVKGHPKRIVVLSFYLETEEKHKEKEATHERKGSVKSFIMGVRCVYLRDRSV